MKVKGLSFAYEKEILKNINFSLQSGKITAIIGVNGAGKSTLMKCLAGVLKHSGDIDYACERKEIGFLTQDTTQCNYLSVFEFVLLGKIGYLGFKARKEDLNSVERILKHIGIENLSDKLFSNLSGGQQRLVTIAQVLVRSPKIMLLDEPTANLDIKNQREILSLIREYSKVFDTKTIINIHDINHAFNFCDNFLLLKDGEIFANDDIKHLKNELLREIFDVEFQEFSTKTDKKVIVDI